MRIKLSLDSLFYGVGVATIWGVSASAVQFLVRNELHASPGSTGFIAPAQGWPVWLPWPSTILGSIVFVVVAAAFVRIVVDGEHRSARLVLLSMLFGTAVLWGLALMRGMALSQGISAVTVAGLVRYAAPLSLSSTIAVLVGAILGLAAIQRASGSRGTDAAGAVSAST